MNEQTNELIYEWINVRFFFFVAIFILYIRWTYFIFPILTLFAKQWEYILTQFEISNRFFHCYLFIYIRGSGYSQVRLSEKWPSPERRIHREKLAGQTCRRNMYVQCIYIFEIKYYSCMIYMYNNIYIIHFHCVCKQIFITRLRPSFNLYANTVAVMRLHVFKKNNDWKHKISEQAFKI